MHEVYDGGDTLHLATSVADAVICPLTCYDLRFPEAFRLAALAGGLHRLSRQIPMKQAMGMILTGRRVMAEEGYKLGFVTEVVPEGEALAGALRWAEQILECSPVSIRTSKDVVMRGDEYASVREAFEADYQSVRDMQNSLDFIEGPLAFSEKRPPDWKGR